jgi:capsular exopolysaccharide synthesis family protein
LVVDVDFRKPAQHKLFGLKMETGLVNVLLGDSRWQDAVIQTGIENIDLMPGGKIPPDPAELLGGQAMRAFLEEARKVYDVILLDSPPLLPYSDACVLAPIVDGVFFVVRAGFTTFEDLARSRSMLTGVNARVMGAVLNGISDAASAYYYYYYHPDDSRSRYAVPARGLVQRLRRRVFFGTRRG